MPVEKSLKAYRLDKKNCAQSILCGFQPGRGIKDADIDAARALGGGRAENGKCGALYAAMFLAKKAETKNRLCEVFRERAGSENCREIRAHRKLSCAECVELAAATLARHECAADPC